MMAKFVSNECLGGRVVKRVSQGRGVCRIGGTADLVGSQTWWDRRLGGIAELGVKEKGVGQLSEIGWQAPRAATACH